MSLISFIFGGNKKTKKTDAVKQDSATASSCCATKAANISTCPKLAPCAAGTGLTLDSGAGLPAESATIAPEKSKGFFGKIGSFFKKVFNGIRNFFSPQKPAAVPAKAPAVAATNIFAPTNTPTADPVVPTVVPTATPAVSDAIAGIVDSLGITAKTSSSIGASEVIKNGDVIESSSHDNASNTDEKLTINQALSTKDALVYDGTSIDNETGNISYIRHTITQTDSGTIVKKQSTKYGKPPSENSGWNTTGIYKYVNAPDGIKEYSIASDGSEHFQCKYVPKNGTTVTIINKDGASSDLTNVSVTKLKNINTGLHDVYM